MWEFNQRGPPPGCSVLWVRESRSCFRTGIKRLENYISQHATEPTFSWILHFPEGTLRRSVFWDGNHAASQPRCYEGSADLSTRALLILTLAPRKAMDVAANCSLRVKRPLLDPRFEGYKLSLEPLPCYQLELDAGGTRRCPLALCSFPPSAAIGPTLPAFSSLLAVASQGTVAFFVACWAGVDPGWLPVENESPSPNPEGAAFDWLLRWDPAPPLGFASQGSEVRGWCLGSACLSVLVWPLLRGKLRTGFPPGASSVNRCVEKPRLFGGSSAPVFSGRDPILRRETLLYLGAFSLTYGPSD